MKAELINRNNDSIEFNLRFEPEDVEEGRRRAYNRYRNYYKIPGFRGGKASMKVIENFYGKEVFDEEVPDMILNDMFEEASKELKFVPLAPPRVIEPIENEPWAYHIIVSAGPPQEILEDVDLDNYEFDTQVSDDEIEEELRLQSIEYGDFEDADTIDEDTKIFTTETTYRIAEDRTHKLVGTKAIRGLDEFNDDLQEEFRGKEAGYYSVTEDGDFRHVITVDEVKKPIPLEINDEFAQKISTFDTLDEYKDYLRKVLVKDKVIAQDINLKRTIVDDLLEKVDFELPEDYVKSHKGVYNDDDFMFVRGLFQRVIPEEINGEEHLFKVLRDKLILDEYLVKERIFVTDEDLQMVLQDLNVNSQNFQVYFSLINDALRSLYLLYVAEKEKLANHYVDQLIAKQGIDLNETVNEL